jgi:hypothetical protein
VIANYVETLMQREQLVEYYLVDTPPGLMLLKASGQIWRLVVMHEEDMQRQTEFARAHKAPKSILSAIEKRKKLGLFLGDSPDNYFGDEQFPWAEYVKSAQRLQGRNGQLWYVALWRDAPADIDFDPATSSYDAYLATL